MERLAVQVRVDGHGGHAHLPAGAGDAHGDLSPVGDEDLLQHAAPFPSPARAARAARLRAVTLSRTRMVPAMSPEAHFGRPPVRRPSGRPTAYLLDEARRGARGSGGRGRPPDGRPGPAGPPVGGAAGAGLLVSVLLAPGPRPTELHPVAAVGPGRGRRLRRWPGSPRPQMAQRPAGRGAQARRGPGRVRPLRPRRAAGLGGRGRGRGLQRRLAGAAGGRGARAQRGSAARSTVHALLGALLDAPRPARRGDLDDRRAGRADRRRAAPAVGHPGQPGPGGAGRGAAARGARPSTSPPRATSSWRRPPPAPGDRGRRRRGATYAPDQGAGGGRQGRDR